MECPICDKVLDEDEELTYNEYTNEACCEDCLKEFIEGYADAWIEMKGDNDYPWGNRW